MKKGLLIKNADSYKVLFKKCCNTVRTCQFVSRELTKSKKRKMPGWMLF